MNRLRTAAAALATTGLILGLSACSSDNNPSTTPSATKAAPTAPAATDAPDWEAAYSPEQLAAYRKALARYTAYLDESEPVWAAGKATSQAKDLFRKYYIPWQAYFSQLEQFDQSGIKIARNAEILDSKATRIVLDRKGSSVTIEQCVDAQNIGATQNDKPLANAFNTPQLAETEFAEVNGSWYITQLPADPKDRPCGE